MTAPCRVVRDAMLNVLHVSELEHVTPVSTSNVTPVQSGMTANSVLTMPVTQGMAASVMISITTMRQKTHV
jgi:hypothetical protein